ncbi:MAG: DHH family phosphoesterase, partial [Phycisphaerales bacterium]|nr:DHH family phosphoesterase [Phycisphaerales bacterium]
MTYESNTTLADLAERLLAAKKVLIITHRKPDGDAIGSCLAIKRGMSAHGIASDIGLVGELPSFTDAIAVSTPYLRLTEAPAEDPYDLIVLVDTGAWSQVQPLGEWLRARHEKIIGIDHHAHGDEIAAQRFIDTAAASTTQILVRLIELMKCPLTGERGGIAEALFIGLATDTGWFRHSNGDASAFGVAAKLLATGVEKPRLYQLIEETARPQRLALLGRALKSLRYLNDGAVAVMTLTPADFRETGGDPEDLTGLVNEPMSVGTVRASILITRVDDEESKISLRSKPSTDGGAFIDVNAVARTLGGGGHVHAAGARMT